MYISLSKLFYQDLTGQKFNGLFIPLFSAVMGTVLFAIKKGVESFKQVLLNFCFILQ